MKEEVRMNTSSPIFWILYIVLLGGMLYFMAIRPQKKEKQRQQELLNRKYENMKTRREVPNLVAVF